MLVHAFILYYCTTVDTIVFEPFSSVIIYFAVMMKWQISVNAVSLTAEFVIENDACDISFPAVLWLRWSLRRLRQAV